jgi:ketosteroid isomerase-like protein
MQTGPISDRLEIRELIEAFSAAAMRIDGERFAATWAAEGAWKLPSMSEPVRGRDEITAAFLEVMGYLEFMSMLCVPTDLVVAGDSARGKAHCQELIVTKTGEQRLVVAWYDDEYVKRDGRWWFLSRTYTVIGKR